MSGNQKMWFKNARLYDLKLDDHLLKIFSDEQELENLMQNHAFRPCQAQEMATCGFAPLYGNKSSLFTFSFEKNFYFKLIEETKLLPASVIKTELEELVLEKEAQLQRDIRPNEKAQLKTALINQLVPKAFSQRRETYIWVNIDKGFCAIGVSSAKRAENALAHLREALGGSFPAKCFSPRCVIEDRMTNWLKNNELPQVFEFGNDLVLKSPDDEGGTIRVSKENLISDEIFVHINAGKVITDLQVIYDDAVSFVLGSDLSLKRIAPLDQYLEKNLSEPTKDEILDLQAHLILQAHILTEVSNTILEIFDCEKA